VDSKDCKPNKISISSLLPGRPDSELLMRKWGVSSQGVLGAMGEMPLQ